MLHLHPVKQLMNKLTDLHCETIAIAELINYIEDEIIKVIIQSKEEMFKLNNLKKIQGLYQKNRIDKDCIINAIKTIKSNNNSHLTQNSVRKVKKKKKICIYN